MKETLDVMDVPWIPQASFTEVGVVQFTSPVNLASLLQLNTTETGLRRSKLSYSLTQFRELIFDLFPRKNKISVQTIPIPRTTMSHRVQETTNDMSLPLMNSDKLPLI